MKNLGLACILQNPNDLTVQMASFHAFLAGHTTAQFSRSPPFGSPAKKGQ